MRDVSNWKGDITYRPARIERPKSVAEIVEIVRNTKDYPSPVRVKGSHHSVTKCVVAEGGTLIDVSGLNQILQIDRAAMTITMQAGVLLKDASSVLELMGLQFYVNVEIGNMTVGSGACCGTKKASFFDGKYESGQVSSYVESYKIVQADGTVAVIDNSNAKLMAAMRSSYGMLGIVCEVTYKIKQLRPMAFKHEVFTLETFKNNFGRLLAEERSTMMYIFPFIDRIVVERRWPEAGEVKTRWAWPLRNWAWKTATPLLGKAFGQIPLKPIRSACLNGLFHGLVFALGKLEGHGSSPEDQIIRYPEVGGAEAYTFSLWAFDKDAYLGVIDDYFQFCEDYFERTGYRCDMPSVGYAVAKEDKILFSYSRNGFAVTVDPVSTGGETWEAFLDAFNERCSAKNGRPLFNQTPRVKPEQAKRAFGDQIREFLALREQHDPDRRFYTPWFRELFSDTAAPRRFNSDRPAAE